MSDLGFTIFSRPAWVLLTSIRHINVDDKLHLLSQDEKQRCGRFRQEDDRKRYLLAHALKRLCLSELMTCAPEELEFTAGEHGKPHCETEGAPEFNLSHSGDYVALAVSGLGAVGVDIECSDRGVRQEVAERVLNSEQLEQLLASERPDETFMLFWTQKEAISKALGLGLSIGFEGVSCSGSLGRQYLQQCKKTLWTDSYRLGDGYILSVCAIHNHEIPVYKLREWHKNGKFVVTDSKTL